MMHILAGFLGEAELFRPAYGLQRRQPVPQQGCSFAACADGYQLLEKLNPPSDGRRNSLGQCLASGGGRRTTWRRFDGSCPMTSRFSRRSITSCSSHDPSSPAHLALNASNFEGNMCRTQALGQESAIMKKRVL